ncbi:MAG: hypothetical protein A3B68_03415 [Candidatus Melainabacteria bacterium RIFCSPHIGHO2_02_FULL_34_12]|nr:MAG: hypothetical protein A3B68_03415 [Candidatus Melainabacteria bacterium RIFCSPHIGHO2_02_FULL_34_12]
MTVKNEINTEAECRESLKKVCNLAYQKGLLSGTEGNLSFKINDDLILVTPRNSHKGFIETSDFVVVDKDGNTLSNWNKKPTTELSLHIEAYKKRPDIKAVVHAHPTTVVSFSVAGIDFNVPAIPEIIVLLGEVPTVPYREPGTTKLGELISVYLEKHDAVIMDHHGAVTVGSDIFNAYHKMESLEHAAKIMYFAHTLGEIKALEDKDVEELVKQRHRIYGEEIELREGSKLFQVRKETFNLKNVFKKLTESNSPVFQRILNLVNDIVLLAVSQTTYSQKLSSEEREALSRELTASILSMILGKFAKKMT